MFLFSLLTDFILSWTKSAHWSCFLQIGVFPSQGFGVTYGMPQMSIPALKWIFWPLLSISWKAIRTFGCLTQPKPLGPKSLVPKYLLLLSLYLFMGLYLFSDYYFPLLFFSFFLLIWSVIFFLAPPLPLPGYVIFNFCFLFLLFLALCLYSSCMLVCFRSVSFVISLIYFKTSYEPSTHPPL